MPRIARRIAESGYYHVILRGNGKRILFENDRDRRFFLKLLEQYIEQYDIECLAWCLMGNHVHLLIGDPNNQLSKLMHDIGGTYASYYNRVNDHVGSVFENRYTSRAIESENYLLGAMRYIHRNPLRAGLTKSLDYPWSSYDEYIRGGSITSTDMILEMLGGVDGFRDYCSCDDDEVALQIEKDTSGRLTDDEALERAKQVLGDSLFKRLDRLGKQDRDDCLYCLSRNGLTISQIARITGIGRNIVQRACGPAKA